MKNLVSIFVLFCLVFACSTPEQQTAETATQTETSQSEFNLEFEKYTLENGLDVVLHTDHSDPVVAVALTFHVGSARELPGRTGFAHLFEHLLFLDSENLGYGGLDQLSSRVGGSGANGSTSRDRTNYFQTVPNDALEKMLWAEAEKLGFFINTVNDQVLQKEKQVVKNEKRQGVDNNPYGHTNYVIDKNLYPEGHPYSWQVIGSLEDLDAATLEDVIDFYNQWYVPNNATLTISGDFDVEETKAWVDRYFAEIPVGEEIDPLEIWYPELEESKYLFHEDNFARLPALTMTFPTVEIYHPDSYPLSVLAQLLSDGKGSPMYKVLVDEKGLTSNVSMFNRTSEIAGQYQISINAFRDTNLNDVRSALDEAFALFESEGFTEQDLDRIKAGQETRFYNQLSSVLGKGFQLAQYNIFAGDPGFIMTDLERTLAVTKEDVMRVYEQYIKGKNYVATSFLPRGQTDLILEGSRRAEVVEEEIVEGAEEDFDLTERHESFERTPSAIDRSIEPPFGPAPQLRIPEVWTMEYENGMRVFGIEDNELPLVQFNIRLRGGLLLDDPEMPGVANLMAIMMNKGTKNRTPQELEEAIDQLGAGVSIRAGREAIVISGNTLVRNFDDLMEIVSEMMLEPRWDEREFELTKQQVLNQLIQQQGNPNAIAGNAFNKLIYGEGNILSFSTNGTVESVENITLEDLKMYYSNYFSPSVADVHVAGDVTKAQVRYVLSELENSWEAKEVNFPEIVMPEIPAESKIYFYDVPNAVQSQIRIGYPALAETDENYYPALVMNYRLGGGGFASQFTQELREGRGYTYGIRSGFSGSEIPGPFQISTGVRSNVTLEAIALIKEIMEAYGPEFSEMDLQGTKDFLLKSNARAFETLGAKIGMLQNISAYNWTPDYILEREEIVRNMTIDQIQELAQSYANPDRMFYVVVGDAATQAERLENLGFGSVVRLN